MSDSETPTPEPKPKTTLESPEDAKTLFLSALPDDVSEREMHSLFRFFGGYEGCSVVRPENKSPIAFIVFHDHKSAQFAKDSLSGMRIDPFHAAPLRIDFARSNSKVKRVPRDFFEGDTGKRVTVITTEARYLTTPIQPPVSNLPPFAFSPYVNSPQSASSPYPIKIDEETSALNGVEDVPVEPSSTVFIGNIHKDVHRNDLQRLFSLVPGLKEFRMNFSNRNHPIAFAEFNDIPSALGAMKTLQGAPVGASRIRLEFSRTAGKKPAPLDPANLRDPNFRI